MRLSLRGLRLLLLSRPTEYRPKCLSDTQSSSPFDNRLVSRQRLAVDETTFCGRENSWLG